MANRGLNQLRNLIPKGGGAMHSSAVRQSLVPPKNAIQTLRGASFRLGALVSWWAVEFPMACRSRLPRVLSRNFMLAPRSVARVHGGTSRGS